MFAKEGGCRRVPVYQSDRSWPVLSEIPEHVRNGMASLARRRQHVRVPTIGPHGTAASDQCIDAPSDAYGEAAHAGRKGTLVGRFDEKMQVIELYGEVTDAKEMRCSSIRIGYRRADGRKDEGMA
jgi:hypothetical protein